MALAFNRIRRLSEVTQKPTYLYVIVYVLVPAVCTWQNLKPEKRQMVHSKILVVDDELHLVHILSYKLEQAGYDLVTAHNGRDGFELACQHKPDLVVTDFQMPIMDGFEMAIRLRSNLSTTDIPIIMLTARGHKVPPADLAKTQIKHLMAKPFSARQLVEIIVEVLGLSDASTTDPLDNANGGGHAA